jgi:flagellar motor switch protein FliM
MEPEMLTTAPADAGPPASRKVKIYDFKRPDKFSKDEIRTMALMHETFARQSTTALSSMLRITAHMHVAAVDQLTYEEFIRSIPNPTTVAVVGMDPLKGSAVLEIDPAVTSAIIDRLFGGQGGDALIRRELTDIECAVLEGIIARLLGNLREAWSPLVDLRPRLQSIDTNPSFTQIVPPTEMVVLVSLEARIGDAEGMMNLCLPYLTIEPIIPKLSAQYFFSEMRRSPESVMKSTASLPMTAEVCYEAEKMPLSALTSLRRGTRIPIPRYAEGDAFLQAGGVPVMRIRARRSRGARRASYALPESRINRDLETLKALNETEEARPDALQETLRAFSAEIGAAVKSLQGGIQALARRQEEMADQLIFQSPTQDLAPGSQPEKHARPFGFIRIAACDTLATVISQEHPQLVALVLSYLEPGLAACVLGRLPEEQQTDVSERICAMNRTSPEVVREVERVLEKRLSVYSSEEFTAAGGVQSIVEILNVVPRSVEKSIIESMEKSDPAMAEEIKKRMFVFEDITLLEKKAVAAVIKETPPDDLVLALKAVDQKVRAFIWECVTRDEAESLKARVEALGRTRLSDVELAQQRIVEVIRKMEEEGRIMVARPEDTIA